MYGPGSEAWALNRESMLLLGAGPRALLLQIAHPAVAAGVDDHSDFRADPWRRLAATLKSYLTIVYGSRSAGPRRDQAAQRAPSRHRRGRATPRATRSSRCGSMPRSSTRRSSSTNAGSGRSAGERRERAYVETKPIGRAFGVPEALLPPDLDAFEAYVARMLGPDGPVQPGPLARELAAVILHPPLARWLPRRAAPDRIPPVPTLDPVAGDRPAAASVRDAYELRLGRPRAAGVGLARRGLACLATADPAACRQMPKALAADRVASRHAGAIPRAGRRRPAYESSRGNLGLNIVARKSIGVAASSASSSVTVAAELVAVVRDVPAERGPERRGAHPLAGIVEQVATLDVDRLVVAGRGVRVDRAIQRRRRAAAAAAEAQDGSGDEVGGGLIGERLARLVVADEPVEPLVGGLVGGEIAQVRACPCRAGSRSGPATPCRTRRPTRRP